MNDSLRNEIKRIAFWAFENQVSDLTVIHSLKKKCFAESTDISCITISFYEACEGLFSLCLIPLDYGHVFRLLLRNKLTLNCRHFVQGFRIFFMTSLSLSALGSSSCPSFQPSFSISLRGITTVHRKYSFPFTSLVLCFWSFIICQVRYLRVFMVI